MKKIVLDIQSNIHAHTMERMLMQELDDCQVVISESPDSTAEWCRTHRPDVLFHFERIQGSVFFNHQIDFVHVLISVEIQRRFNGSLVIITLNDLGDHEALKESADHSAVFQNIRRISSTNTEHLRKALSASYKQVKKRSIFNAL